MDEVPSSNGYSDSGFETGNREVVNDLLYLFQEVSGMQAFVTLIELKRDISLRPDLPKRIDVPDEWELNSRILAAMSARGITDTSWMTDVDDCLIRHRTELASAWKHLSDYLDNLTM